MTSPARPKIYHITYVDNLARIVQADGLLSDMLIARQGGPESTIGMNRIKERRMAELRVKCYPDTFVGDYVPFYFCPRSVILFVISCANNPDLPYKGGQRPIVHLAANLNTVIEWADQNDVRWAFSLSNAGARYVQFRKTRKELDAINWAAVHSTDFRDSQVKEAKQAEILVHGSFPWHLVERIGVMDLEIERQVTNALRNTPHKPPVEVHRNDWYY